MLKLLVAMSIMSLSSAVMAEESDAVSATANGSTIGKLLADGYEIKAAVPNGKRFVVFLQKDSTGYACEMASLSQSQCGKIN